MANSPIKGIIGEPLKGKIGVLIEEHFDQTEFRKFNEYFPEKGYQVEYLSHLWGNPELTFGSNPEEKGIAEDHVTVSTEVNTVAPSDYKGILLIGAYATDRLRYQANPRKGQVNQAPAVVFLRKAVAEGLKIGTICHSLWLFCADPALLKGRKVTCAHNIICDVENAGGEVIFEGDQTADLVIDGNLISGKHPAVTDRFMETFLAEIEKQG